jgi:hypothetical protein
LEIRKETRAHGETDVLVVCYTPYLDRTAPGTSVSEGAVERHTQIFLVHLCSRRLMLVRADTMISSQKNLLADQLQ